MLFFDLVSADPDALFAALYPPPKGGGEGLLARGSDQPLPAFLEGVGGKGGARQHCFHS